MMEANDEKIRIFQYGLKCFASMGFIPNQRLNAQVFGNLVVNFLNVSLNIVFLMYEANTFWEYINSIFISLTTGVCLLLFIMLIFQVSRIFEILDFGQKKFDYSK